MATSNEHRRVTKRSSNACSRCRRQKIKCSGQQPCANCGKRNLTCIFDDRDNKVLVTQGYLSDLQAKVARLQNAQNTPSHSNPLTDDQDARARAERSHSPDDAPQRTAQSSGGGTRESTPGTDGPRETANLTNPLIETPSRFMAASNGQTFYMGTSSNWSFHGQVLSLVHEHMHKSPLPAAELLFDGSAYDLPWDGTRSLPDSASPVIPSIDYAIFLINAVKFHCGQMMHLFEEEEFMFNLHAFYSSTGDKAIWKGSLWYIHFLMIIAFGKTFVQQKNHSPRPPGADFFIHALQLLPDTNKLCRDPIVATEVLCCIALYLQSLDSRNAAHVTIGQAMRIALIQGMHTDMPVMNLGDAVVQRCRKVWWTIFILDRHMTSLMGLPQSIRDEDVSCQLPNYNSSPQRAAALNMQIKLAKVHVDIASTVYGSKGRLRKKFVLSIKTVLDKLAGLAEELRNSFPLHSDERFGGISRLPAHSHLYYYQTIVIVTRPLLFCCMKKVFESPQQVTPLISSPKIRKVLHMSLEASQKILVILESLQEQGLLETFLPWDLDALFVSTMVLIVTRFVDTSLMDDRTLWLEKAFGLMETMIAGGNRIADYRMRELRRLDEMLAEYAAIQERPPLMDALNQQELTQLNTNIIQTAAGLPDNPSSAKPIFASPDGGPLYSGFSDEGSGFGDDLTAEQILAVAESMDIGGTDWLSFGVFDNYQPLEMVDPSIQ
ncbi:C6 transcription factor [Stagonosporopsis vannaccii]|nr:C6 transcription factor [Stagonosporopsis vannaccii]